MELINADDPVILLAEIKPEDVILFPVIDEKEPDDPVILFPETMEQKSV